MTYRIKIAEKDLAALQAEVFADLPKERGAFALAGIAQSEAHSDILVRRPIPIPQSDFVIQEQYRLEISSRAINGLISLCESNGLVPVLCHSHPAEIPYSATDDFGELRIAKTLWRYLPPGTPVASLLFYPGGATGRVWTPGSDVPTALSEIYVVGAQCRQISVSATVGNGSRDPEIFDRQVRAFGVEGQRLIERTKVAIVGIGGTGSPTAEQLVRLGVQDLLIIDPDEASRSMLTRVYGTFNEHVNEVAGAKPRGKASIVADHLRHINPAAKVQVVASNVVLEDVARLLVNRDIIFLCTDDHWGRSIVNQIAYQYLIPVINMGMQIASENGRITNAQGCVDVLRPDLPCLWCRQALQADRIAAESLPRSKRVALSRERYVPDIDTPAPSVISITTAVSGMSVTLFLQLLTGFMGDDGDVARLNYFAAEGTVRRGRAMILEKCVCKTVRGLGDKKTLNCCKNLDFLYE